MGRQGERQPGRGVERSVVRVRKDGLTTVNSGVPGRPALRGEIGEGRSQRNVEGRYVAEDQDGSRAKLGPDKKGEDDETDGNDQAAIHESLHAVTTSE